MFKITVLFLSLSFQLLILSHASPVKGSYLACYAMNIGQYPPLFIVIQPQQPTLPNTEQIESSQASKLAIVWSFLSLQKIISVG